MPVETAGNSDNSLKTRFGSESDGRDLVGFRSWLKALGGIHHTVNYARSIIAYIF